MASSQPGRGGGSYFSSPESPTFPLGISKSGGDHVKSDCRHASVSSLLAPLLPRPLCRFTILERQRAKALGRPQRPRSYEYAGGSLTTTLGEACSHTSAHSGTRFTLHVRSKAERECRKTCEIRQGEQRWVFVSGTGLWLLVGSR